MTNLAILFGIVALLLLLALASIAYVAALLFIFLLDNFATPTRR